MFKKDKSAQERGYGEIAKSAFGGLVHFGTETGRLVGKSAKVAWKGARRVGGKAKVRASETATDLKEKAAETATDLKEKAAETATDLKVKASDKASEIKEKRAADAK